MDNQREHNVTEESSLLGQDKNNGKNPKNRHKVGKVSGKNANGMSISQEKEREPPKFKFSSVSRREKTVLILCAVGTFLSSSSFSLLGPFFPKEAAQKGMAPTVTGFVFGVFQAIIFVSSPFYGAYLTKIGAKFVYLAGIFMGGSATVMFGLLDMCPSGVPFAVICISCRVVCALGVSAFNTASFAIVSSEFPNNIGRVFGVLETGSGLGFILGPLLGGVLYDLGGFGLPFYCVGGFMLFNGLLIYFLLPHPKVVTTKQRQSIFRLMKIPLVFFTMCSLFTGVLGICVFDSSFSYHFIDFNLPTSIVSLFFIACSFLYTTLSSLWAYLTDVKDLQAPLILGGHFVFGLGFLVMGPSPLLPFIPLSLWSLGISSALLGLSLGCLLIPTMKAMVNGAIEGGFENNIETFGLVSGLFNSINSLGGFIGPVGCGALLQEYGYPITYTVIGLVNYAVMLMDIVYYSVRYFRKKRGLSAYEQIQSDVEREKQMVSSNGHDIRRDSTFVSSHPAFSRSTSVSDSVY